MDRVIRREIAPPMLAAARELARSHFRKRPLVDYPLRHIRRSGRELEADAAELLEWENDDEGMNPRTWLVAGAAAALVIAALVIRRRRAIATAAMQPTPAKRPAPPAEGEIALGPGERTHLGIVFDEAELDVSERIE